MGSMGVLYMYTLHTPPKNTKENYILTDLFTKRELYTIGHGSFMIWITSFEVFCSMTTISR